MSTSTRGTVLLAIGAVMIGLGLFIALRPLMAPGRPITSSRWLDVVFAAFFLIRGVWNVRIARRAPKGAARGNDPGPP